MELRNCFIKREGLTVLKEEMDVLDPNKNEIYKILRCKETDKINVKWAIETVKKEIEKGWAI